MELPIEFNNMKQVRESLQFIPVELEYNSDNNSWLMSDHYMNLVEFGLKNDYAPGSFALFAMLCDIGIDQGLDSNLCMKFYISLAMSYKRKHNLSNEDLWQILQKDNTQLKIA